MTNIFKNYDIYLGTVAGSILQFKLDENNKKKHNIHLRNDEKCEISSFSWGRTPQEVLIGYKNGSSKIYNLLTEESIIIKRLGNNKIIGVVPFDKDLIIGTNLGNLYHWNKESCEEYLTINTDEKKTVEKILTNPYNKHILGVGGDFNDIKLYDINTKKIVFAGKADRHDELELAQPISISTFTYFNNQKGINLGTVTKQGQIRIYDTRAQRRPIKIYKNTDAVYTCISATNVENEICVGSNKGYLSVMDLRKQIKPLKSYKGFMGGLTDIYCDLDKPIVASCCLDRHFRVHNLQEKSLEYEEYIKIQTPYMLMRSKNNEEPLSEDTENVVEEEDIVEEIIEKKKRKKKNETKESKKVKNV